MLKQKIISKFLLTVCSATLMSASIVPSSSAEGESKNLSLQEAVTIGIQGNPQYGTVAASRRATDEELRQGVALYYPSINLSADSGWEHNDTPVTRSSGDNDVELWRNRANITLTQMLFDGFNAKYEVARQEARVNSSAHRVRETSELVGLSVVESYLEVLRQRELLNISRKNVEDHINIQTQIAESVNVGRGSQSDLVQVRARIAQARATESSTRQALRNAESEYLRDVGETPGTLIIPSAPYGSLSSNVEDEVKQALANSPTLDIFTSDIEVAYAEAQGTKSTFYPQVDLELSGTQANDISGVKGRDTNATALLTMNWNLYRGGADTARAKEFIHRHQQTKEQRAEASRNVAHDVRQTWASMISSRERAQEFSEQAQANTEVIEAYKDQFILGRRTLLDVLDAQNELFVSKSNTVNSSFLEVFALYRILALKGALLPTLEVAYASEGATMHNNGEAWPTQEWTKKEQMEAR